MVRIGDTTVFGDLAYVVFRGGFVGTVCTGSVSDILFCSAHIRLIRRNTLLSSSIRP